MAAVFKPEDWVYRPMANMTVQGKSVPVSGFTLYLTASGIPRLVVTIDPFHLFKDPVDTAGKPGLLTFVTRWRELQESIRERKNREVDFSFDAHSKRQSDDQKFELKKWLMISAGFQDIQARGGFTLAIELVHPLYAFQESSGHLFGSGVQNEVEFTEVTGANVYEALIAAMEAYLKRHEADSTLVETAAEDPDYAEKDAEKKSVVEEYRSMVQVLKDRLEWDPDWTAENGHGFPDVPFKTDIKSMVPYSVMEYVKAMNNAGSWDWLVRTFCAEWFLTVIPAFFETKLKLRPIEPWAQVRMTIQDTDIEKIELPAVDPTPIKGVLGLFDSATAVSMEWGQFKDGEDLGHKEEISWTEKLPGRYLNLAQPGWMRSLIYNKQAQDAGYTSPQAENLDQHMTWGTSNNAPDADADTIGTVDDTRMKDQHDAMKLLCKELFLENYRQQYQTVLSCRLLIQHKDSDLKDHFILPGFVMRVHSNPDLPDGSDEPILDFFVTQVVHSVDCYAGRAVTQIGGGYVHDADQPNLTAIEQGVGLNAMYKDFGAS